MYFGLHVEMLIWIKICSDLRWAGIRTPLLRSLKLLRSNSTQLNPLVQLWTYILPVMNGGG